MSRIPYYVEKLTTNEMGDVNQFALDLSKASAREAYALKQIVPICDEDGTSELYAIYEFNYNLIRTILLLDKGTCDEKYLTAEQIELIKKTGFVEVNGDIREIEDITISWTDDKFGIMATIELKEDIEE